MERPMVVKDMKEHLLPKFPLMMQPKKDGLRCMVDYDFSAWCRPRKKKPLVQHRDHVQAFIKQHLIRERADGMVFKHDLPGPLDGELVIPGLPFPDIQSGVKGNDNEFCTQLVYPIFDLMIPDMAFACRYALLEDWYKKLPEAAQKFILLVPAVIVHSMEQLEAQQILNDASDEGSVIRDMKGLYTIDKSTRAAVRYKFQKDSEFLCVDVVDGKGKDVGVAKFVCVLADGKTEFSAASTGELADRKLMFTNKHEYIGKWLTLQYQELLPSGKPRFGHLKTDDSDPTFKAVRDVDDFEIEEQP